MKKLIKKTLCLMISLLTLTQVSFSSYQITVGDVTKTIADNGMLLQTNDSVKNTTIKYDALGRFAQEFDSTGVLQTQYNYDDTGNRASQIQFNGSAGDVSKAYILTVFAGPGGRDAVSLSGYSSQDLESNLDAYTADAQAAYNAELTGGIAAVNTLGIAKNMSSIAFSVATLNTLSDIQVAEIMGFKNDGTTPDPSVTADITAIREKAVAAGVNGSFSITLTGDATKSVAKYQITNILGDEVKATDAPSVFSQAVATANTASAASVTEDYTTLTVDQYNTKFNPPIACTQLSTQAQAVVDAGNAWTSMSAAQQGALTAYMTKNNITFASLTVANINAALTGTNALSADAAGKLAAGCNTLGASQANGGGAWGNAPSIIAAGFKAMADLATTITADMANNSVTITGSMKVADALLVPAGTAQGTVQLDFSQNAATIGTKNNPTQNIVTVNLVKSDGTKTDLGTLAQEGNGNAHNYGSYDPLVKGTIENVVTINGKNYVVVKANSVDMFDGKGSQAADGEEIYVAVDAATAANIKTDMSSGDNQIVIAGNVQADVNGHLTMSMNEGGYKTGTDAAAVSTEWTSQNTAFYKSMTNFMEKNVWSKVGVQSDWSAGWAVMKGVVSGEIHL